MRNRFLVNGLVITVISAFASTGCNEIRSTPTSSTSGSTTKKDVEDAQEKLNRAKAEYTALLKADLEKADRDYKEWKEKTKKALGEDKVKFEAKLKNLEERRAAFGRRLDELKDNSKDAWEEMKKGMDKAWDELKKSYEDAKQEFK